MVAVTQRIKQIKQPRGGYVPPRSLEAEEFTDEITLHPEENISPIIVGIAVDYLTRIALGHAAERSFRVSVVGAGRVGETDTALRLLPQVTGLDPVSVVAASKLSGFDVAGRGNPMGYRPVEDINPDATTIENIQALVKRNLRFLEQTDSITLSGFQMIGGYTDTVTHGDGDILTLSAVIDFKVSKNPPTKENTLQGLMYLLMGKRSMFGEFDLVERFEIYNPRLNVAYRKGLADIDPEVIQAVERDVIGY